MFLVRLLGKFEIDHSWGVKGLIVRPLGVVEYTNNHLGILSSTGNQVGGSSTRKRSINVSGRRRLYGLGQNFFRTAPLMSQNTHAIPRFAYTKFDPGYTNPSAVRWSPLWLPPVTNGGQIAQYGTIAVASRFQSNDGGPYPIQRGFIDTQRGRKANPSGPGISSSVTEFVRRKIADYYAARRDNSRNKWMYKLVKGSPRHMKEIFIGRCWDFLRKKARYVDRPEKLDCNVLWDAFLRSFAHKRPCAVSGGDYKHFFDLYQEKPLIDRVSAQSEVP